MDVAGKALELDPVLRRRRERTRSSNHLRSAAGHEVLAATNHQAARGLILLGGENRVAQSNREVLVQRVQAAGRFSVIVHTPPAVAV